MDREKRGRRASGQQEYPNSGINNNKQQLEAIRRAPVVLGFNYEVYKMHQPANSAFRQPLSIHIAYTDRISAAESNNPRLS